MNSLWNKDDANAVLKDQLQLRVYTSRLLGRHSELVLYGGGNTSVKAKEKNVFGEIEEILYVKGSGVDLKNIQIAEFAPVKLEALKKMVLLEKLDDDNLLRLQRTAMTDPDAPNPSIEAMLHAIIPFKYVDHTHADSVVTISNSKRGEKLIHKIYKNRVIIVPYVKSGFMLAKTVYEVTRSLDWGEIYGIILMNHGVVTFADDARMSYDRMIRIASKAETYLKEQGVFNSVAHAEPIEDLLTLARIRHKVSKIEGDAVIARLDKSLAACGFVNLTNIDSIATLGPMIMGHVIHTKAIPVIIGEDFEKDIDNYSTEYKKNFDRNTDSNLSCLNTAPCWGIWPKHGSISFGRNVNEADIVADIARHTMKTIQLSEAIGGWQPLSGKYIFQTEYLALQQAKIKKEESLFDFQGKIALVTGAASGIGRTCAEALYEKGAVIVGLDINPEVVEIFNHKDRVGLNCDITDSKVVQESIEFIVRSFGGLDILVLINAGVFPEDHHIETMDAVGWNQSMKINLSSHKRLLKTCIPYLKHGIDPTVIYITPINFKNTKSNASTCSLVNSELIRLAKITAEELAPFCIRVNIVHTDAVFDTERKNSEDLKYRAKHYGRAMTEYKTKNFLQTKVTSKDIATMVCTMAGRAFAKTTGALVPVYSGNQRVI